jgi:UDP-2,3-diacylglucosamine pyrophosphatase LpxH
MIIRELTRTYHEIISENTKNSHELEFLLISDLHIDSLHCKRDMLIEHMKEAVERGAKICIFGDVFDLMQGRYDPRGSKQELNPNYLRSCYLDAVIEDGIDLFSPYAEHIALISEGNHETNIKKRLETSPIDRLVQGIKERTGFKIMKGGYSGWIAIKMGKKSKNAIKGSCRVSMLHYHHGFGGNAPRSKGALRVDIDAADYPDANIVVRGHTHQKWSIPRVRYHVSKQTGETTQDKQTHLQLGSYKDGKEDNYAGWEVEKNFAPTPLGGWWAKFSFNRDRPIKITVQEAD